MDALTAIIGLLAIIAVLVGLCLWMLVDIARINRPNPADELPPQSWRDRVQREQEGRG